MATVKKIVKNKFYSVVKPIGENEKCPPQARLIINTIAAASGTMSREDLLTALKRSPEEGGLKTNQTAERILGFYRPRLEEMGVLKEEVVETEVEVEVADKAPKETPEGGEPTEASEPAEAPASGKGKKGKKVAA